MTKDNILFGVIGLLLGCIVGFLGANSLNQNYGGPRPKASAQTPPSAGLPADHPPVNPSNAVADQGGIEAIQQQIQKARQEPNNFEAQMNAAVLFYRIGRYDEAIEFLLKANQLKPEDYQTLVRLGDANFDAEHYKEAESWYAAALAKSPEDVNVRTDLGTTFMARQPPDFDRAIKEYLRALEINPKHEQTLHNLVIAFTKKGQPDKARQMLDRLAEVNPNNTDLPRLRSDVEAVNSK
jgi:tetratricopeptide (TPR) repeat protein